MSDPGAVERRIATVAEAFAWSIVGLWALSSLWYPFGWDQGIIAWVGSVIVDGDMPYRDAFDLKGPAAYYIFAIPQWLFGHNMWGIRLLDLVGIAAAAWVLARVVRRLADSATARWAAALFVLWFAGLTFWHTAQPDGFAAMLLCFGVLPLLLCDKPTVRHSAWAGITIGITCAIKPTYAAFIAVPAVHGFSSAVLAQRGVAGKQALRFALGHLAVVASSAALVVTAFAGWFAYRGALDGLIEVYLQYNAQVYSSGSSLALGERLRGLVEYVREGEVIVALLPAALFGAWRLYKDHPTATWTLATWTAVALAGVAVQNKFFDYQWIPLFPPVVIFTVVGLRAGLGGDGGPAPVTLDADTRVPFPRLGHALALVILFHATIHPAFDIANWGSYVTGLRDRATYYDTFGVPGDDYRMARYIEEHSDAEDRLIVLGWNVDILYMANRETVSRLAFNLPIWVGDGTEIQARYRSELMRDLGRQPPELIVVQEMTEPLPLIGRPVSIRDFVEFQAFLRDHYRTATSFGSLTLYRLSL